MTASFLRRTLSHRACLALAALVLASAAPIAAFAWGYEGHRVTGLVANELLTARTRIRLNQLIPNANLGDLAIEMDVYRLALGIELPGSNKWHQDNQPICGTRPYEAYCPNGECASTKIPVYFKVLGDINASPDARAQAAKFVIHMLGDIHQPLHAAEDYDLGGNQKNVLLPGAQFPRRLHAAWDSDLVKLGLRGISEADYAKQLVARFRDKEIPAWQAGELSDWMIESQALGQKVIYGNLPEFTCGVPWPAEKVVSLPQSYVDAAQEVIPTQLAKAGARIAWLLNRALDSSPEIVAAPAGPARAYAKGNPRRIEAYVMLIGLRNDMAARWRAAGKWPDVAEADKAVAAHVNYWQDQLKIGRALFFGEMKGNYWDNSSMIVFEAASLQEAEKIVANDPAVKAMVYQAQVRPFDVYFISDKYSGGATVKAP